MSVFISDGGSTFDGTIVGGRRCGVVAGPSVVPSKRESLSLTKTA